VALIEGGGGRDALIKKEKKFPIYDGIGCKVIHEEGLSIIYEEIRKI
jgi:hypothetical protein